MSDTSRSQYPAALGDYRLERLVARGGMGEIWSASTPRGERVAIKRLLTHDASLESDAAGRRLMVEADALAQIDHPHVVHHRAAGQDDEGNAYLVLDWLDGQDLYAQHSREPLSLARVLEVATEVLEGLTACHRAGIVHRDIKPANIFLARQGETVTVKLIDFGLALITQRTTRLTRQGHIMGTLHYMSPEQVNGDLSVDLRTDIYSLGVVLYELCTGKVPFDSSRPVALMLKIVTETPRPPCQVNPTLSADVEALILKAMQRAPDDRYGSAAAMAQALAQIRTGAPTSRLKPVAMSFDPTLPLPSSSHEVRLVTALFIEPLAPGLAVDTAAAAAVEAEGGTLQRLVGGRLVGLFGLTLSRGDDALRAVRAGLALLPELSPARLLASVLRLEVGDGFQRISDDLEQAVAAAAGLQPGRLYLDAALQSSVANHVATRVEGDLFVALPEEKVRASQRRVLGAPPPFVGRDADLQALRLALENVAVEQQAAAILICAKMGLGKTRLLEELLPEIRQRTAVLLEGSIGPTHSEEPYALFRAILTQFAGVARNASKSQAWHDLSALIQQVVGLPEDELVAAFLGELLGVPRRDQEPAILAAAREDPREMRLQIICALEVLITRACARGPLVAVVEDLQYADEATLSLIVDLAPRISQLPVLLLATTTPFSTPPHPFYHAVKNTQLSLRPLGQRALRAFLDQVFAGATPPGLFEKVAQWSGGNPRWVEELLAWMAARGILWQQDDGRWRLDEAADQLKLPPGLQAAVQGTLDSLSPALKELVKIGAVLGSRFWDEGCRALGHPAEAASFQELAQRGLISPLAASSIAGAREWVFRNDLLQTVAYGMLPEPKRQHLHLEAARWLEQRQVRDYPELARHFRLGGDLPRAAHYLALAGEKALSDGYPGSALELLRSSASLSAVPGEEQARRQLQIVNALIYLGQYLEAEEVLSDVDQLQNDSELSITARVARGRIFLGRGRYQQAEEELVSLSQEPALGGYPEHQFAALRLLFWVLFSAGRYQDSRAVAERLRTLGASKTNSLCQCEANMALVTYHSLVGDLSAAIELAENAVALAQEAMHNLRRIDALTLLGYALDLVGQYDRALTALAEAEKAARRINTPHHLATIACTKGRVLLSMGRSKEAYREFQAAIRASTSLQDPRLLATSLSGKARAAVQCPHKLIGEAASVALVEAEQDARRAEVIAREGAPPCQTDAILVLMEIHLARGEVHLAAEEASRCLALLEKMGSHEQNEGELLLVAYAAYQAAEMPGEAQVVLERAWRLVNNRRLLISDEAVRYSFTHHVEHNRRALFLHSQLKSV